MHQLPHKKFVRFYMRNKKHDITLSFVQAERIVDSPNQLVKVLDEKTGQWTGITINKAEIISTDHDFEREKEERYNPVQLPEPIGKIVDTEKFKPEFLKQKNNGGQSY